MQLFPLHIAVNLWMGVLFAVKVLADEPMLRSRTPAKLPASVLQRQLPPRADGLGHQTDEQRLLYYLMSQYERAVRPVRNASAPIVVKLGLTLTNIFDMDEKNQVLTINVWLDQEWNDELLRWDPAEFGGLDNIRVPCDLLWLPDIVLYNNADDYTTGYMRSRAMVWADGTVFWPPPTQLRSTCKIDVTYFPFDAQRCHLKFGSWTYHGFQVDVTNRSANVDLSNYVVSGEFELVNVHQKRRVVNIWKPKRRYTCCPEPYPDVTFFIHVRRKTLYYMYNVVFPCMMMSALTLLVFCLPPDSGEKIALGITVLLAFSVFVLAIAEKMPETSDSMPLIGIYLTIVMGMTSVSVVMTVMVLNFHHRGPYNKEMPHWVRWLILDKLRRALCIRPPGLSEHGSRRMSCTSPPASGGADSDAVLRRLSLRLTMDNLQADLFRNGRSHVRNTQCESDGLLAQEHERQNKQPSQQQPASYSLRGGHLAAEVARTLAALADRQAADDRVEAAAGEWRCAAQVLDRLLFWVFLVATVTITGVLLVLVPLARHAYDTDELDEKLFGINPV